MTAMKTPEELRAMGIVVGSPLQPPPRTPEEIEELRRQSRVLEKARRRRDIRYQRALKRARQAKWVDTHREAWNDYKKKWRRDRRLSHEQVIHEEVQTAEELVEKE